MVEMLAGAVVEMIAGRVSAVVGVADTAGILEYEMTVAAVSVVVVVVVVVVVGRGSGMVAG